MTSHPTTSRITRTLRGIGALLVLVAVVAGVPILLTWMHLSPHAIPTLHEVTTALRARDDGQLAAVVIAAGAWICWALFTISLVPEITGTVRHRPAFDLPGLGAFQRPAGALVTAIAIALTAAPLTAGAGTAAKAAAPPPPLPTPSSVQLAAPRPVATLPAAAEHRNGPPPLDAAAQPAASPGAPAVPTDQAPTRATPTYVVQRRDTLWAIAERYLHNPLRYSEITHLNPTTVGPDNEITPGAVLTLPPDATGLPGDRAAVREDVMTEATVRPGDTLWDIEQQLTGSGANWPQGWQANAGRTEPGGATYTDPDLIQPGWTLTIPTPPPATATTPTAAPTHPTSGTGDQHAQPTPHDAPSPPTTPPTTAPTAPSTPAQSPEPTGNSGPSPARTHADSSSASDLPMLAFAGGGGLLLAGLALTALTGYRRRQFRHRRPGRIIAGTPAGLIATERAVRAAGSASVADVTWLDQVLRGLVQTAAADPDGRLPDVIAVRLTADELTLVLAEPSLTAPPPWRVDDTGGRWTIQRSDPIPYEPDRRGHYFAPYPTLTSVGHTGGGEHWLLDLERIGALSLVGDQDRCLDLARFLAAELAHNTWSEMLQVTLVGFGKEMVAANPDRLTYTDDLPATIAAVARERETVLDAIRVTNVDLLTGRLRDIAGDTWAPHVVLVAPQMTTDDANDLDTLLASSDERQVRASVALVTIGDSVPAAQAGWQLTLDSDGSLRIPALDVELFAQQLPAGEACGLAQMLACAAVLDDAPIPAAHGNQPWDQHADACGGLTLTSHTTDADDTPPDGSDAAEIPALHLVDPAPTCESVLPLPAQTYLDQTATTEEDLDALAPTVDAEIRVTVEQADPQLDADLAAWDDPTCPRPRLSLLGPVRVRAQNQLPERSPQEAFHTEVVAYLATRTHAVPSSVYAETMWPTDPDVIGKTKVRQSITTVRRWLGTDPDAGQDYLPSGLHEAGLARYRINGALIDAELFRRLRLRGVARGAGGIDDLWRALHLVHGPPFHNIPAPRQGQPGGYSWMSDANSRPDHEYSAMIVDTAHTLATHHLAADQPDLAAKAAQVALKAGSYEDTPLLDLVKACLAQRKEAEAEAYIQQILTNHDAEIEEDLPPRTAQVLLRLRRQWVNGAD